MTATLDWTTELERIDGTATTLAEWKGQVLLIVNTASRCGFTGQYAGLEKLWRRFRDRGFAVLGFPCNQFMKQEPGDEKAIATFCSTSFAVDFPLFSKITVNGAETHPLFEQLKDAAPGLAGTRGIKWNFTKFLVDREGQVVDRFAPTTAPEKLVDAIEALLPPQ